MNRSLAQIYDIPPPGGARASGTLNCISVWDPKLYQNVVTQLQSVNAKAYIVILMSMKSYAVDMQLHMTVKALAIMQGEINCKLDELIKKAKLLQEKEEAGEEANYLFKMISDNLNELADLFEQRRNLRNQIENLKRNARAQKDLMEQVYGFAL